MCIVINSLLMVNLRIAVPSVFPTVAPAATNKSSSKPRTARGVFEMSLLPKICVVMGPNLENGRGCIPLTRLGELLITHLG